MNIQRLPISKLKPAPYNPRKVLKPGMRGYRRLERSLSEFDLVQPLVWNKTTGHVVSGHQRLEILKARGVTVDLGSVGDCVGFIATPFARPEASRIRKDVACYSIGGQEARQ